MVVAVAAWSASLGCSAQRSPVSAQPAAEWTASPTETWPQIVLTNRATFRGHSPLSGASAFLVQTSAGKVAAATGRHLLGSAGGVEPPVELETLRSKLKSWEVFPRTRPTDTIVLGRPWATQPVSPLGDWLLFEINSASWHGVQPLLPSRVAVTIGSPVHLIGCPYSERDCTQNVYSGVVTEVLSDGRFRYTVSPAVDLRGFSGGPVVDARGHVVGIIKVWFQPLREGDLYVEAGADPLRLSAEGTILTTTE